MARGEEPIMTNVRPILTTTLDSRWTIQISPRGHHTTPWDLLEVEEAGGMISPLVDLVMGFLVEGVVISPRVDLLQGVEPLR